MFWNQVHHWNNKCMLHLFWGLVQLYMSYENLIQLFPSPNILTEDLSPAGDTGSVPLQMSGERDWSGCWPLSPSPVWEVMLSGYISPDPDELLDPTLLVSCYRENFLLLKCSTQFTTLIHSNIFWNINRPNKYILYFNNTKIVTWLSGCYSKTFPLQLTMFNHEYQLI